MAKNDNQELIPLVQAALLVDVVDGEIVLRTQHDAVSLTAVAALKTAFELVEAARSLQNGNSK